MLRRKKGKSYPLLMKRTSSLMFVLLVLFWPACNKGQKSKSNASVEFIDGVECIHNTGTALHPDKTVTFVEDLSISGEDKDGNIILYEPMLSFVDDNENIYIIEIKDQVIKVFGPDGKYIKTIGAKGSGPGEFQTMTYLAVTKDGKLVVMDQTSRRTSLFDSSGRFLKSFHWQTYYSGFIMIKSSSYITSEFIYSGDRQFRNLFVKEVDFNGKEIRSYGEFTTSEPKIIRQGKYTTYFSLPVSTDSIFAGDPDRGLFYHCVNNKYIIDVYDTSGKLLRKIDRPYEPVPFTDKDAKAYRARFGDLTNDFLRKAIEEMEMPKVKSVVERMYVDDKGNLWIRTNEIKEEEDKILTAFDIFDSDGYYFAKVWTAIIPYIFKKGKMYRMDTDQDTGYQSLKRYKVIWK
ncbi:MAG: 6-bladed beta-propeller [Candidatus Aminicenantes bacterium]|nr:6-bladed beta-propeller [Candidatus Aminicenantes bacterium]